MSGGVVSGRFALGFQDSLDSAELEQRLDIEGTLPEWLRGTYLRNGPAWFTIDGQLYNHWFDGLAKLHRFDVRDDGLYYLARFLESRNYVDTRRTGKRTYDQFATNPPRSLWQKIVDSLYFPLAFGNNDVVSFGRLDDTWCALGETPTLEAIDPITLRTTGDFAFTDRTVSMITSPHPIRDERRRALYNYSTFVLPFLSRYQVWAADDGARARRRVATIRTSRPAYMHSFGASDNYLVLTEYPLRVRPSRLLMGTMTDTPFIENFEWTGEDVVFTVIAKDTGEVTGRFTAAPFFCFHHVNAWEDGEGGLVLDLVRFADDEVVKATYFTRLLGEGGGRMPDSALSRYRLPIHGSGALMPPERLADPAFEMPNINPDRVGFEHRFVYGFGFDKAGDWNNALYKVDLRAEGADRVLRWQEDGCYPSEPFFVARPDGEDEDDGVVLSVVLDTTLQTPRSFLLVLDARTFTETARASTPDLIPYGFHGAFDRKATP